MAKQSQEDLFASTTMTFGEHLEELRVALWKAVMGIAIGALLGFGFGSTIVEFVQEPLTSALGDYYLESAIEEIKEKNNGEITPEQITLIEEEHVVPDRVLLSTESVIDQFARAYPEQFVGGEFDPYRFRAEDIISEDAASLAGMLAGPDSERVKAIAAAINADGRSALTAIAKLDSQKATTPENRQRIADALNSALDSQKLYESKALTDQSWPQKDWKPAVDKLLEQLEAKEDQTKTRRLNRLLISAALVDEVKKPRDAVLIVSSWRPIKTKLQALGAHEAFMIWLKAAFIAGMILASPWVFWQIWHFVAAGLYPHEQNYVYIYLPFSLGLFIAGAALAFNFVFEHVLRFLFTFNRAMNIDPDPRISEWLSFVLFLPLGFGISFQLPLVMLFLNRIGIFSVESYVAQWRMAILVIFVVSMFLTPADPISMMLMAVPLTFLYFGGIMLCKYMPKGRNPFDEVYEP